MSIAALLMLAGAGDTPTGTVGIIASNAYRGAIDPASATATYSLTSAGVVTSSGNASDFWIVPQVGMELFEARAVLNTGSLSSGTVNTWLPLSTTRSWQTTQSGQGSQTANLTIQIRRASDAVVLAEAVVTITAEVLSL